MSITKGGTGGRSSLQGEGRSSLQEGRSVSIEGRDSFNDEGGRTSIGSEKGRSSSNKGSSKKNKRPGTALSEKSDNSRSEGDTGTPRSAKTTDDWDDDDDDDDKIMGDGDGNILEMVGNFLGGQVKSFVRNFVDYGEWEGVGGRS
jgi:hypothetical protein